MNRSQIAAVLVLCLLGSVGVAVAEEPALERELARLEALSGGSMGIAAIHVESGRAAYLNPDQAFPMASTYKVPIAVELLHRVDQGERVLDQMVQLAPHNLSPGSGMLSRLLDDPGVSLSLRNLLELMLLISDNSATDLCLREAGGGEAVTARMRALGIEGIRVDRPTLYVIADWVGIKDVPSDAERHPSQYQKLFEAVSEAEREAAADAFESDPRDTATPRAMGDLLEKIWKRKALSETSAALLIDIMERCETGEDRVKGRLPEGTVVAHKTGTIGRSTNDVGIITLPHEAGHVIVAAFVKDSELPVPDRERAIADAARAAHDYFLFTAK
jgi:beta-lactamase class A